MKRQLIIPVILLTAFVAEANASSLAQTSSNQYQECVAVSLYTIDGRELDSIVRSNRKIEKTNTIPEGWTVVGVTTKNEAGAGNPHMVICH